MRAPPAHAKRLIVRPLALAIVVHMVAAMTEATASVDPMAATVEATPVVRSRWMAPTWQRLVHALAAIVVQRAILTVLLLLAMRQGDFFAGDLRAHGFAVLAALATVEVLWLGVVRAGRIRWRDLGWRSSHLPRELALGIAGGVLLVAALVALLWLALGVGPRALAGAVAAMPPEQRLLMFELGVQGAFTEETLFRGYLQPALVARLGAPAGVCAQAAIFALYHLQFSPVALLGKLVVGLGTGVLAWRTRSLLPGALAHALVWWVLGAA